MKTQRKAEPTWFFIVGWTKRGNYGEVNELCAEAKGR